ncbi:hypothetical protein [Pseudooceanicola aestuarii]|uniref:hypothetical protein n=1 Tax=Pseudooceanicola aestuarii TaxID=2697319 RepID=UPI0013D79AF3|nr:hypothetical protein [Pseudooceanicola aestuarii]
MNIYLDPPLLASARAGAHNFLYLLRRTLEGHGYEVEFHPTGSEMRSLAPRRPGFAMFHMEHPTHSRAFTFRRVYQYPFWTIETDAARWNWNVALADFSSARIPDDAASKFMHRWQTRLYGARALHARRNGFVYVPLQGQLLRRRSFQSASPLEMLKRTLEQEDRRKILATLHPKEIYHPEELQALEALSGEQPRLRIVRSEMVEMLEGCDYVVTQNSSAAFAAMFFGKPSLLFARSDFHHITLGPDDFDRIASHVPDYAGYVWWFWQHMSINAGRPEAEEKIAAALRRCGMEL